jgi:hypothetical protein
MVSMKEYLKKLNKHTGTTTQDAINAELTIKNIKLTGWVLVLTILLVILTIIQIIILLKST